MEETFVKWVNAFVAVMGFAKGTVHKAEGIDYEAECWGTDGVKVIVFMSVVGQPEARKREVHILIPDAIWR